MAEREGDPAVRWAIADLSAVALLTVKTDGWDDVDVTWVTPEELGRAALTLRRQGPPPVGRLHPGELRAPRERR